MAEGALFRFVGVSLQRSVSTVVNWLESMLADRPPAVPKNSTDPFTAKVVAAFGSFVREKVEGEGGVQVELVGKAAIDHKFATVADLVEKKSKITLEHLKPFGVYKWLLSPEQQAAHQEWLSLCMVAVPTAAPKKTLAFQGRAVGGAQGSSAKKRKTDAESSLEFVDSLFS